MEEHSLLGHGLSGEVYYPSIDCDELKSSYDYVSKIGLLETMQKEKEAYDKLPLVLDGKLYFKFAKICAINNTNRANLVIKYIPGNTLEEYLNNFKKYNHNGEIISEEVFKKLLLSWLGLVNNIKELIRLNYVHSDIQASNIMYDSIKNHMYLVDFGHFQSIENENNDDMFRGKVDFYLFENDLDIRLSEYYTLFLNNKPYALIHECNINKSNYNMNMEIELL